MASIILQIKIIFSVRTTGFCCVSALCIAVQGDFSIAHAPSYMKFLSDAQPILASEIPVLVNSAFGFSIPRVSATLSVTGHNFVFHIYGIIPCLIIICNYFVFHMELLCFSCGTTLFFMWNYFVFHVELLCLSRGTTLSFTWNHFVIYNIVTNNVLQSLVDQWPVAI